MNATKPQGIDQDEVEAAIVEELVRSGMPGRPNGLAHVIADRILALVRPVKGVTLTPEEATWLVTYVRNSEQVARDFGPGSAGGRDASWFAALAARLEAAQ